MTDDIENAVSFINGLPEIDGAVFAAHHLHSVLSTLPASSAVRGVRNQLQIVSSLICANAARVAANAEFDPYSNVREIYLAAKGLVSIPESGVNVTNQVHAIADAVLTRIGFAAPQPAVLAL